MNDKKKLRKIIIILLLIVGIVVAFVKIKDTLARYASKVSAEKKVDVAFYLMDNSFKDDAKLILDDILPSETAYEYTFTVSNSNGVKISETTMEYDVIITATTNLPLTYTIEKDGEACSTQETIIQDDYGTYYKQISILSDDNDLVFEHSTESTNEFVIKVLFPKSYSTASEYADLIENVRLEVSGRQVIDEIQE